MKENASLMDLTKKVEVSADGKTAVEGDKAPQVLDTDRRNPLPLHGFRYKLF